MFSLSFCTNLKILKINKKNKRTKKKQKQEQTKKKQKKKRSKPLIAALEVFKISGIIFESH